MCVDQIDHALERRCIVEPDAHLNGEQSRAGGAKCAKDAVDVIQIAEQTPANVLLVHLRRGAAEVQINPRNRVAQEFSCRACEMTEFFADELRKNGAPSRVFIDGTEDMFLRA